jgi:hypothetical protein
MSNVEDCFLFAGPSLSGIDRLDSLLTGVRILPPIQRGDLPRLLAESRPASIAIADGKFHQCLAVGHAEIREAIDRGVQVWGLSSMGAIRAAEMTSLGMRGYGEVFRRFSEAGRAGEDFQDDEVALLHDPEPPYRAGSEPLIHMRVALECWAAEGRIAVETAPAVAEALKSAWYGARSLASFATWLKRHAPAVSDWLPGELADFDRFRVKSRDLERFLVERPWSSATTAPIGLLAPSAG